MSIFQRIRSALRGGAVTDGTSVIVDGETFLRPPSRNGNSTGPRDKLSILRRLAPFAEKEGIHIIVVFHGPPLREAADGATFRGLVVHYAEGTQETSDIICRLSNKTPRGKQVVIVTADTLIEQRLAGTGALFMKSSSLRRALDTPQQQSSPRHEQGRSKREKEEPDEPDQNYEDGDRIVRELIDPL